MSHHSLETRAAETLPDSISMVVWTRNNRSWLSLGLKVTVPQQLYQPAARPQSQSLYGLGPAHGGSFGCWLTSYSLCLPTRNQAELAWGKNSLWGETPPSAMCFPCPIPGTSNYGRQVFLLLHTSETWLLAVQLFPADSSFRDFYQNQENQLGSCPGYRLHWARILLLPSKNYFYKKK